MKAILFSLALLMTMAATAEAGSLPHDKFLCKMSFVMPDGSVLAAGEDVIEAWRYPYPEYLSNPGYKYTSGDGEMILHGAKENAIYEFRFKFDYLHSIALENHTPTKATQRTCWSVSGTVFLPSEHRTESFKKGDTCTGDMPATGGPFTSGNLVGISDGLPLFDTYALQREKNEFESGDLITQCTYLGTTK